MDKTKEPSTLQIGGEPRPFKLDYRGIREAKKQHGIRVSLRSSIEILDEDITDILDVWLFIGLWNMNRQVTPLNVTQWTDSEDFALMDCLSIIGDELQRLFRTSNGQAAPEDEGKKT